MKFARKISVGGHLKRMLHLLTSQITKCTNSFNDKTPSINDKDLKESHFKLETDKEWINFGKSTFKVVYEDNINGITEPTQPLLGKVEQHMPHRTSESGDKIIYTTVDEAHSGSVGDVGSFLLKLKKDLHIGNTEFPKFVMMVISKHTLA